MYLHIDPGNGLAIYDQVVRQIMFAVANGAVKSGEMVPSVRELARDLALNPNTIARAYRELQTQGVLVAVRGAGLRVAKGADATCRRQRLELIRARLRQVLVEAHRSRLDGETLRSLFDEQLNSLSAQEVT